MPRASWLAPGRSARTQCRMRSFLLLSCCLLLPLLPACGGEAPAPAGEPSGASSSPAAAPTTSGAQAGPESGTTPALDPPPAIPGSWEPLVGEYARGADTVSIMEDGRELKYLRWNGGRSIARLVNDTTLEVNGIDGPVTLRWADAGPDRVRRVPRRAA